MQQLEAKCAECRRTTVTHAPGCSHPDCPHRLPQSCCLAEGAQGFPGRLAEDRVLRRMSESDRAVSVEFADL